MLRIIEVRSQELEDGHLLLASEPKIPAAPRCSVEELLCVAVELDSIATMVVLDISQDVYGRP
jgi:hypothetical protein